MKNKIKICVAVLLIMLLITSVSRAVEVTLKSEKYLILEEHGHITRIIPETTVAEFKTKFNLSGDNIHVFGKDNKEITQGYISTEMKAKFAGIEQEYALSVIGDINGDGKMNQIDLSNLIRHVIKLSGGQLEGLKAISADISGDGKINQVDINEKPKIDINQ